MDSFISSFIKCVPAKLTVSVDPEHLEDDMCSIMALYGHISFFPRFCVFHFYLSEFYVLQFKHILSAERVSNCVVDE